MNIDKIFGLFDQSSDTPLTNNEAETLFDLKNTPVFWLGMFKKIIVSSNSLYFQLNTILPQNVDVQEITNSIIYTRSWEFISKIDIFKSTHIDAIKMYSNNTFIKCFNLSISYWEALEEYEKCAHLKKIQDKSREFANQA
jgi:hypothetical protein